MTGGPASDAGDRAEVGQDAGSASGARLEQDAGFTYASPESALRRGRPSPRLYAAVWLCTLGATGSFVAAALPVPTGTAGILIMAGLALLAFAFVAAAAWQVAARSLRPASEYRGPSPLLLVGAVIMVTTVGSVALSVSGTIQISTPFGTLETLAITALAYAGFVWLFVVRVGALSWSEMGWPVWSTARVGRLAGDILSAVILVGPTYVATALAGGFLALALGVETQGPLPTPTNEGGLLLTILSGVVVAPIGEELFFRGFALTAWLRDLGAETALRRSTVFFAAAHLLNLSASSPSEALKLALLQFAVILPIGYALGWLFLRRGIVASIAGHMTFNGIGILLLAASAGLAR